MNLKLTNKRKENFTEYKHHFCIQQLLLFLSDIENFLIKFFLADSIINIDYNLSVFNKSMSVTQ